MKEISFENAYQSLLESGIELLSISEQRNKENIFNK